MNIYEIHGRQTEAFEAEKAAHLATIDLLRRLAVGDTKLSQLVVTADTWQVLPLAVVVDEDAPEGNRPLVIVPAELLPGQPQEAPSMLSMKGPEEYRPAE